jgi:hypothetical protein
MNREEIVAETLIDRFGYKKREAKQLAKEIIRNLHNYVTIQEAMRQKFRGKQ